MRDARIRAIAGLPTGETFSPAAMEKSANRLRRTGAFRSVRLTEAEEPNAEGSDYRLMVLKRVPQLMKLDGIPVTSEEREKAATFEPAPEE